MTQQIPLIDANLAPMGEEADGFLARLSTAGRRRAV